MAIEAFSNLLITLSDGGTVPSIDYLLEKTYVNIGSGNILKVSWNTPAASGNKVDSYRLYVTAYDLSNTEYKCIYDDNIGLVNEFYLKSDLFSAINLPITKTYIYVEAISKYGAAYNSISNIEVFNVCKGCGIYTKVEEGYAQPIMKRAVAFTRLGLHELLDADGKQVLDADGKPVYLKASSVQDEETGWTLLQELYAAENTQSGTSWQQNDIRYEVLTDINGEIITDSTNENIYVL